MAITTYLTMLLSIITLQGHLNAQNLTQTIRGRVIDQTTQTPLPGATVVIIGSDPILAATTGTDGSFSLEKVPLGRHNIEIRFMGYLPHNIPGLLVGSGKEVVLTIELEESVAKLEEVVVKATVRKDRPGNPMALVSARGFNVEETRRYAGGMDDPARLATAFAGVTAGGNNQDNAIVIRGNAPKTVQWRVEGVEIANPHHFSGGNVAGGGFTSIISSQMLTNSDFYTGAFPAEYGNALSGVFDIKLRTGNNQKNENALQIGMMGVDYSAEGPFKKGGRSSYLFNYRYSTFGLLSKLGAMPTDQTPIYQDLSFKMVFPAGKAGTFSLWGMGGIDNIKDSEETDSTKWETDYDRVKNNWDESFGAIGINNKWPIGTKTMLTTSIVATGNKKKLTQDRLDDNMALQKDMKLNSKTGKISLNTFANHKINARLSTRTGINLNSLQYNLNLSGTENEAPETYRNFADDSGQSMHIQAYSQFKCNISNTLSLHAGLQTEHFALTGCSTIDPRLSFNWDFSPRQSISAGYGKHSQLEDLSIYLIKQQSEQNTMLPNKKLDFSHAHHFVLGYNFRFNEQLRLKIEPYYQYLYNIPGIADSSFSMINFRQDLTFQSKLGNNTIGRNMGIDATLERFLQNNFYYLATASIFQSKYRADDGIWRNTRYNKNFVANFLVGKEFYVGKANNNLLGINLRGVIAGGERTTPLDNTASMAAGRPIYDEKNAFSKQDKTTKFINLTVTYRVNKAKYSGVWALQLNNLLGEPQLDKYEYNHKQKAFVRESKVYKLPSISYKIEF